MNRQQRLLAMLAALQARRRTTAKELAAEFGVSVRTVMRDVEALAAAEVPVFTERGRYGGIVLLPGTQLDVSRLSDTETELLTVLGIDLVQARKLGMEAAARSAIDKLTARGTPQRRAASQRSDLIPLAEVVAVDHRAWFVPDEDEEADIASLTRDLRRGRRLRVRYRRSGTRRHRPTVVDPYGVLLRAGRWYLVADTDGEPRMYALSRLAGWEVLDEPRILRPNTTLTELAGTLGAGLEDARDVVVTVRLDADRLDIAKRILGKRLLSTETADANADTDADGTVLVRVGYDRLDGVRQLLQFSDHFEVVDPPAARELVARLAGAITLRHRTPSP
ncbi:helix-turn-helix transcriptional regulator [Streptomyces sp. NPDC057545]|uniref:helix-turn-helix transcriptional regulator n=1 Tax=Streptomyces sp. NPDC057545 TaxID=3346164 RepID=UPI0036D03740